jgi:osmoprotectant transport system permease protein
MILAAFNWITNPENWNGGGSIGVRLIQHLSVTFLVVAIASLIALPLGVLIGHTRCGGGIAGAIVGSVRSIPTLGLLTLIGLVVGIGLTAPLLALIVLALPSLLVAAYSGIQAIEPSTVQAATAIGMNPAQVIFKVELPLAAPTIVGGLRSAILQVVSTATLAAYTADIGLGRFLFTGLKTHDYPEMLGSATLVILLALLLELVLAGCQKIARNHAAPSSERPPHHVNK